MNISEKTPIDLNKWCCYIITAGHATATLIILAHPSDIYLRNFIILPEIGFFISSVGMCVCSARFPRSTKEFFSLSQYIVFSLYLSLTHESAKVLLGLYILPIFASAIRRIFIFSLVAVMLPGIKMYFSGSLDSIMVMETFVACFMLLCSYLLAKVLILYGHDNLEEIIRCHEEATKNELAFLQAQINANYNIEPALLSMKNEESVIINVRDTGIGMSAHSLIYRVQKAKELL